jgi:hypothetical protein
MPLQPVKDINEFLSIQNVLKKKFEAEKTGAQTLLLDQTKLFKPLINVQNESAKAIQDKIVASQDITSNALIPFTRELQRRNDQVDLLNEQPFFNQELPAVTDRAPDEFIKVDLDAGLNETDIENLELMSSELVNKKVLVFDLPSVVFAKGTIQETLTNIKSKKRSLGQKASDSPAGKKTDANMKQMYASQIKTLDKYRESILGLEGAKQFVSTPKKSGTGLKRGRPFKQQSDVIFYNHPNELLEKLALLVTAKQSGNTGLDNTINSILDELQKKNIIIKDEFDTLFKNIFV